SALKDMSPYHLLYGREPVLPVDVPKLLTERMNEESPEAWAAAARRRGEYLKELMPAALENLHTAQLRDARRYQQRRGQVTGGTSSNVTVGREVYLRKARKDTLELSVGSERWRVKEIRSSGVLVLENVKGETRERACDQCSRSRRESDQAAESQSRSEPGVRFDQGGAGELGPTAPVITYQRRKGHQGGKRSNEKG
ncbi:hypothetical protein CLOM_g417, partial [Closterium sp. NIES-68]